MIFRFSALARPPVQNNYIPTKQVKGKSMSKEERKQKIAEIEPLLEEAQDAKEQLDDAQATAEETLRALSQALGAGVELDVDDLPPTWKDKPAERLVDEYLDTDEEDGELPDIAAVGMLSSRTM
jgi:hypothetical protein